MISFQGSLRWWLIASVCSVLGVYFIADIYLLEVPLREPPRLLPSWYSVETPRGVELQQKSIVGNCFICHAFWVPIPQSIETSHPRFAHANITLNHGDNDRCYNCHHITDRNMYIANNGGDIMVQTPEKLCGRCHGLIYKDWQSGTHGKWTGMWQPQQLFDRTSYTCTECHDPHDPAFRYAVSAPPPLWPPQYRRTRIDEEKKGAFSAFLIEEQPKEMF